MQKLYFVRHGESQWNAANKICGATDIPLTENGREQARRIAEKIKRQALHIDEIRCSPLQRAAETARHIASANGIKLVEDSRISEQCFGRYEGTARNGEAFLQAKMRFADSFCGGESMLRLAQRVYNFLDELAADKGKTYLVVAHNGIARVVHSYFFDMTNEEYAAFGLGNCEIKSYEFD